MTATDSIDIIADPQDVFDVLMDPACYVSWVVGASRLRDIDNEWPQVGSRFHHSIGAGPFAFRNSTTMLGSQRPEQVRLKVRALPMFVGEVEFNLAPVSPGVTRVVMSESSIGGPVARAPIGADILLSLRNKVALRRLARVVRERLRSEPSEH